MVSLEDLESPLKSHKGCLKHWISMRMLSTIFRAKLIEQFQLVYKIGKLKTLHFFTYKWVVCILLACFMLM